MVYDGTYIETFENTIQNSSTQAVTKKSKCLNRS